MIQKVKLQEYKNKVLQGGEITKEEALNLYDAPLEELCKAADEIRKHFCGNHFDICTIINAKSGKCSENCKFCSQSSHYHTGAGEYPLLSAEEMIKEAKYNHDNGILRYSIVTSGRSLTDSEVDLMCSVVRQIREEVGILVCVSFGLLRESQFIKLKEAGVTRVHNNLESSRRNFPNICTTHTYDDKIRAIRSAQSAGITVCSGGIMGLLETKEDRIEMALTLRSLGIQSVPINVLNPIPGTPFAQNELLSDEEIRRIVSTYRFLLPAAYLRLAGGRGLMKDKGAACFQSGANAAISGDMLTTSGITVREDLELIKKLGYEVGVCDE